MHVEEQTARESFIVLGDSVIRNAEGWICSAQENHTGFTFVRNWRTSWDKPHLFRRDGLHLNLDGTRLLSLNIKKTTEQLLN